MFVEAASKMYMDILMTAKGGAAHSAVPSAANAIYKISQSLPVIESYRPPLKLTPFTKDFLDKISPSQDEDAKATIAMLSLADEAQVRRALNVISEDEFFKTQLTDTITPTLLNAGVERNSVSATATATLNCRLLPSTDPQQFFDGLAALFKDDPDVSLNILEMPQLPFPQPPLASEDPLFKAIELSTQQLYPGAATIAGMSPASTESEALRRHGITAYGIGPVMDPSTGPHIPEESIEEQAFNDQLKLTLQTVLNFTEIN